jgi:hypothetical protein
MERVLFLGLLILIVAILWKRSGGRPWEGFTDTPETPAGASPGPTIPLVSPRDQTLLKGEVKPFAEPSTALLAPPPGQIASVVSRPASDPVTEKAPAGRIQSVLESLIGFFTREAPGLSKIGDPSVQLPLSTAKGDRGRLEDEIAVLKRNPGLESSMTVEDVNGVEANLGYLQKKWRLSVNALSGSPIPPSSDAEGFQDIVRGASGGPSGLLSAFTSAFSWGEGVSSTAASTEGFQDGEAAATDSDMTLADLQDLTSKIDYEILRLSASGTTDANTRSRIDVLSVIKKTIDDLIVEVDTGKRAEKDIPIKKSDVTAFLPAMVNMNTGLPELIAETGTNSLLNSLFSKYGAGDISGAQIAEQMFQQYAADFLKNLSYDVNVRLNYKGEAEQAIARDYAQAMADAKFVAENSAGGPVAGSGPAPVGGPVGGQLPPAVQSAYRGFLENVVKDMTGGKVESVNVGMGGVPVQEERADETQTLERFSWKERSKQICEQVATRGYSPREFGCLDDPDAMKREGFSWRGYTRMVCTRLGTIYEPGVPELCGCPPATWPGWRA